VSINYILVTILWFSYCHLHRQDVFFVEYFYTAVLLATFVIDIIIFFIIFRGTSTTISLLTRPITNTQTQQTEQPQAQQNGNNSTEQNENKLRKIKMLSYFLWMTLAYMFLSFILGAIFRLIVDLSTIYNWLNFLYADILDLLFFIGIAWTFRLRGRNIYFLLPTEEPPIELQSNNTDNQKQLSPESDSNLTPS